MVDGEGDRLALAQGNDLRAGLGARFLFYQHEFAAAEVSGGVAEQDR